MQAKIDTHKITTKMSHTEKEGALKKLGTLIDELDSLAHALRMTIPDNLHVESMRASLPEKVEALKEAYVEIAGENPWEE